MTSNDEKQKDKTLDFSVTFDPKFLDSRFRLVLYVIITTPLALALGLLLGRFLLPVVQALFFFPVYSALLRRGRWMGAFSTALLWALIIAVLVSWATLQYPAYTEKQILVGASYREEMLEWIRTGVGRESDIRLFLPQHLMHLLLFSAVTLVTGGFLGLVMGAVLMNYMSFYVGVLLTKAHDPLLVALLGWPPWAVIRVVAYILIATALSALFYHWLSRTDLESARVKQFLWSGISLAGLDVLLKWLLAPVWQRWLESLTRF